MLDCVIYEHPLNERIRIFLRLEHLFQKIAFFIPLDEAWASRAAVDALLDILNITARADIKSEILKERDRYTATLAPLADQPGVDTQALQDTLKQLELVGEGVYRLNGQLGQQFPGKDFLNGINQRSSIPSGTCSFDLPHYHHWLNRPHPERRAQLQDWVSELEPVRDGLDLLLSLARNSRAPKPTVAPKGFYQGLLDTQVPVQMVRVSLEEDASFFPEISGHRNRFSIRFWEVGGIERKGQTEEDVEFLLTTCAF